MRIELIYWLLGSTGNWLLVFKSLPELIITKRLGRVATGSLPEHPTVLAAEARAVLRIMALVSSI